MTDNKVLQYARLTVNTCGLYYGRGSCRAVMQGDVVADYVDFIFNGTAEGWSGALATLTPALGGLEVLCQSPGVSSMSISGLSFSGSTNDHVLLDITRVSSSGSWLGRFRWTTGGHGFDPLYKIDLSDIDVGERKTYKLDMSAVSDWTSSTITGLQIVFENDGTSEFVLHNVRVGHDATEEESTGTDRCYNTRSTCQDPDRYDSEPHDATDLGVKIESYKASPGAATLNLAARPLGAIATGLETRRYVAVLSYYRAAGDSSLTSATVAGKTATVRENYCASGVGVAVIDCGSLTDETSGTVSLVFSASIDHIGLVSYDLRNSEFSASESSSGTESASLSLPAERDDFVVGANAAWLLGDSTWTGIVEDTDDSQSSLRFSAGYETYSLSLPDSSYDLSVSNPNPSAPTVVFTRALERIDSDINTGATITGMQVDDIVLVFIHGEGISASVPAGWSQVTGSPVTAGSTNSKLYVYWYRLPGTSLATTIIEDEAQGHAGGLLIIRGCRKTGNPFDQVATGGVDSTTSISIPSVTTTLDNALILDIASSWTDTATSQFSGWSNSNLSSITELIDKMSTFGNGGGAACASSVMSAKGATGTTAVTIATSTPSAYMKLSFTPPVAMSMVAAAYSRTYFESETEEQITFAVPTDYRPTDPSVIPCLRSVSHVSARLRPGEDLGTRSKLSLSFDDIPHTDTGPGFDKYHALRSYNPYERGSLWPKFRARQPFLRGAKIEWIIGTSDQSLSEMESRLFLVENFSGPSESGEFTISALDPLKMLDGDRSQAPRLTDGRLVADLTNSATSFTITPTGAGELYTTSGHIAIGGAEIVSYTRSGDVFTITRAQLGTTAVAHSAQDRIQQVRSYVSMDPADIIYDLMIYAGVPAEWLPIADWQTETESYLNRVFTAHIAEPTSVSKLISELMQQAGLSIWWDSLARLVRLRVLRQISTESSLFDEGLHESGTFRIREQQDKRLSQVWTFYGQKNPLLSVDDKYNYRSSVLTIDLDAEREYNQSQIKKIYSRWIAQGGRTAAERVNSILISRYRVPPRLFSFALIRNAQEAVELGSGYRVGHRVLQDASGLGVSVPTQAVSVGVHPGRYVTELEEFSYVSQSEEDLANRSITIDANTYDINCRTLHDNLYGALRTGDNVHILIEPLVVVGGTILGSPALEIGDWPTLVMTGTKASVSNGVITGLPDTSSLVAGLRVMGTGIAAGSKIATIDSPTQITLTTNSLSTGSVSLTFALVNVTLEVRGMVLGRGGVGGKGANDNGDASSGGKNGENGSTALRLRYPITMIDEDSLGIGGGGGGGAGGSCADFDDHRGGGGGGGAGALPGAGGIGPGNGEDGLPGTLTLGGLGKRSYTSSVFWSPPSLKDSIRGGDGGDLGQAGSNDVGDYDVSGGSPGSAGLCIDGIAYVNNEGPAGPRYGSTS